MYRPGPRTGPAMMGARCLWPRLCPVSQLSPGRELCLRWWGWWWPLDPDPGSPGQLPSSLCAVQAAQARVSVTPVSVTQHSPARPQVTQVTPATQSRSAQRERVLVTHCQPPVRSDIHQCWGSGDSIQCVLTTEESVRHWPRVSLGSLGVTRPLVTDCDMWDCEPCDHQHQPRLTVSHPAPLKVKIQLRQSQSENGN